MSAIRVSAVEYLNARPLVYGLDGRPDLFDLQFDIPAPCSRQLHDGAVDLGLIPSIEYARGSDYRIVPGPAVVSEGEVASVALFTTRPATSLRSIAVDSSSRTAAALVRVLCAEWWDIEPKLVKLRPELPVMLKRCDAALVIGDPALFLDHEKMGLEKVDLGDEWTAMTSLPFVWATWAGRANAVGPEHIAALIEARDRGVEAIDEIVAAHCPDGEDQREVGSRYLRENVSFDLDDRALAGLKKFYDHAYDLQLVLTRPEIRFFDAPTV